jgi:Zn-dependent peptidase ImmA (M78 family)/transcriptional regulator with XRE-family HTH domain
METGTIGRRIRTFREHRGLTLQQLGDAVDLRKDQLSKIETGVRSVEVSEAAMIADALGVTISDLLGKERNKSLALAARVMTPIDDGAAAQAQRRVRQVLEADSLITSAVGSTATPPTLVGSEILDAARGKRAHRAASAQGEELAQFAREKLGLLGAPTTDLPELVERQFGADVLIWPTGTAVSGLCAHGDGVALVFASSSFPVGHQRFTLAHELAHHLLDDPIEVVVDRDLYDKGNPSEARANGFAAELLMPADVLRDVVAGSRIDAETFAVLMRTMGVSYRALIVRLHALRLITTEERAAWEARTPSSVLREAGDPAVSELVLPSNATRVPRRLWRAAQQGYVDGKVGIGLLAGLLDEEPEELYVKLSKDGILAPVPDVDWSDL